MKKYYLAYGSNLNLSQMEFRCPTAMPVGETKLEGYRLVYKGSADNYSYLTIEEDKDSFVPLGIFELSSRDIRSLDTYEGYPLFYSKKHLPVIVKGKERNALIYVMNKGYEYHLPSIEYIQTCMQGYYDFNFDSKILRKAFDDTLENMKSNKRTLK